MVKDILKNYLKGIHHRFSQGDAREESFYPVLEKLVMEMAGVIGKARVDITIRPNTWSASSTTSPRCCPRWT